VQSPPATTPGQKQLKGLLGPRSLAIAAVVGSLAGVLSVLIAVFDIKMPLVAGGNGHTGTTPTTTGSGSGPQTGQAGWSGQVWLARGGVDLDVKGGRKGDTGADLRKDDLTEIAPGRGASVVQWPGVNAPGLADCRGHVEAANAVPLFDVAESSYFCVLTTEGQIAVVQYLGIGVGGQFGFGVTTSGAS